MSKKNTTCVAVLGLGAMGSRMATNLLKAGYKVVVWNRTLGPERLLQSQGAAVAATPREAAQRADFVITMVRDDDASRTVWSDPNSGALAELRAGAIAIDSSTLSPAWTRELGEICKARDVAFLEAPVAGSRPQADTGQLIYFVGGQEATLQRAEPLLRAMGVTIHHVGTVGNAAVIKLMVNAMFGLQVAGLAEILGMARKMEMDSYQLLEILGTTPVASPAAKLAGGAMLARNFVPMFPIELVEKDFSYVLQTSRQVTSPLPLINAAHNVLVEAARQGLGTSNITSLASLY
jgi:3-hydroxyisobutyrate dehydrogenase